MTSTSSEESRERKPQEVIAYMNSFRSKFKLSPQGWGNIISFLALIALVVYTFITGRIWIATNGQLAQATQATNIAQEDLAFSQRAFVTYSINEKSDIRIENGVAFQLMEANDGNGPTRNLVTQTWCILADSVDVDNVLGRHGTIEHFVDQQLIAARQPATTYTKCTLSNSQLDDLHSNKFHLFIIVVGVYDDIGNLNNHHVTEFCREAASISGNANADVVNSDIQMYVCPRHNCNDNQCGSNSFKELTQLYSLANPPPLVPKLTPMSAEDESRYNEIQSSDIVPKQFQAQQPDNRLIDTRSSCPPPRVCAK